MYSYTDYYNNALAFSKALLHIGFHPKDAVGIIGFNSPEYHFALHGTWMADGVTAGIYTTNNELACCYVLKHSEAVVCVCQSGKQLTKILSIRESLPLLKAIVVYWADEELPAVKDDAFARLYKWEDFLKLGASVPDAQVDAAIAGTQPGSCATLIYTSGTTGDPKGVMCSHDACTYNARAIVSTIGLQGNERVVGYLPLNHVAAQYVDAMIFLCHPITVYMAAPDALRGTLTATMKKAKPTVFVAVPRVYEKMMDGVVATGAKNSGLKKRIAAWARRVGYRTAMTRQYGCTFKKPWLYGLAKKLVFDKVRQGLGLDEWARGKEITRRCRTLVVSAAPVTEETLRFFAAFDMPIYDLLGQSEATAPVATCSPVEQRWKVVTSNTDDV
mgnify:FL=1